MPSLARTRTFGACVICTCVMCSYMTTVAMAVDYSVCVVSNEVDRGVDVDIDWRLINMCVQCSACGIPTVGSDEMVNK